LGQLAFTHKPVFILGKLAFKLGKPAFKFEKLGSGFDKQPETASIGLRLVKSAFGSY
jgi:hypothetical protein